MNNAYASMGHYYAKGSRLNVLSHLRQLCIFCVCFKQVSLPVSKEILLGFIELLSRSCGSDHIGHVLDSIKFMHEFTGHVYPGNSIEFTVLLKSLKRKLARPIKQVLPITPEMLILMWMSITHMILPIGRLLYLL